jgi:peptide-methionine (S)-S-oxide reductase
MTVETATLAGGCFWCTEAVFNDVIGVSKVESGYIGGTVPNPTYKQVCGGDTGHAEAIRVTFDTDQISTGEILDIFLATHDPTQLNRQGNDVGTQYRSAIFPHSEAQRAEAEAAIDRARADWPAPIVTTIEPLSEWYPAED